MCLFGGLGVVICEVTAIEDYWVRPPVCERCVRGRWEGPATLDSVSILNQNTLHFFGTKRYRIRGCVDSPGACFMLDEELEEGLVCSHVYARSRIHLSIAFSRSAPVRNRSGYSGFIARTSSAHHLSLKALFSLFLAYDDTMIVMELLRETRG